jgi:tetratricopeptide (TPR) repeat protein
MPTNGRTSLDHTATFEQYLQACPQPVRSVSDSPERARELYARGEFQAALDAALAALQEDGDDITSLRVAGRASVELGSGDALDYLRRVTVLLPEDADAWRDLGDALAAEGRLTEAVDAWTTGARLRPDDSRLLVSLGHAALAEGMTEEATSYLRRAAEIAPRNRSATLSLVDLYRASENFGDALGVARSVWENEPEDVLAGLDVAELCLAVGALDAAEETYTRLLEIDDEAHEIYARYGLIDVALRNEAWTRASELAAAAARVDSSSRTSQLLTFFADRAFASIDPSATSPDVGAALTASRSGVFALPVLLEPQEVPELVKVQRLLADARLEHRRIHVEAVGMRDERAS